MTLQVATVASYPTWRGLSGSASDTGTYVVERTKAVWDLLQRSFALGLSRPEAYADLERIYRECQVQGWDGDEAAPVSVTTFARGLCFLDALPLGCEAPGISADPDGHISFEWYRSPDQTLTVSLDSNGILHYAALLGPRKIHGSEPLVGRIPTFILSLIRDVISE